MRVVAGTARGLRLVAPPGRDTRPTLDRVRQAVFNSLGSLGVVDDSVVVDLFAGSGALGIEALSRGARRCEFVEHDAATARVIETNLATTGLADRAAVHRSDALRWLDRAVAEGVRAELVLLDPPYAFDDESWASLLGAVAGLAPGGVVVVESDRRIDVPAGWDALSAKKYGGTLIDVLRVP